MDDSLETGAPRWGAGAWWSSGSRERCAGLPRVRRARTPQGFEHYTHSKANVTPSLTNLNEVPVPQAFSPHRAVDANRRGETPVDQTRGAMGEQASTRTWWAIARRDIRISSARALEPEG